MANRMSTYIKNIKSTFEWKSCLSYFIVAAIAVILSVLSVTGSMSRSLPLLLEKITYSVVLAVSLCLVVGFLGELSLGHAAFMGIGAYIGGYLQTYVYGSFNQSYPFLSILLTMAVGGLAAAVFGFIVGLPALRLKGDYLAIVTLAFGEIVKTVFGNLETFGGATGLTTSRYDWKYLFIIGFVVVLFTMFFVHNLIRSKQGRAITAIRDNEIAARSMGICVTYYKLTVFVVSAFFAGIAGVLYSNSVYIFKSTTFDYNYSINLLVMVVLGGMSSINGSIVAAALITCVNTQLARYLTGNLAALQNVIYALVLIFIVIFNNSPKFKTFREKYNLAAFGKRVVALLSKRKKRAANKDAEKEKGDNPTGNQPTENQSTENQPRENQPTEIGGQATEGLFSSAAVAEAKEKDAYALETKNLSISFGGLVAVKNVNLAVKKGELYGLIGPNGAGKTTVFNMLTGVYKPTLGEFFLYGKPLSGKDPAAINRAGIARTFQNIRIFDKISVIRNVMVGLENRPEFKCSMLSSIFRTPRYYETTIAMRKKAKELLRVFGLEEDRNLISGNLPYGKQRKLEIARALATNPKVLLLDEPAAGMNPYETQELMQTIRLVRDRFHVTVLLIEHDMKLVAGICERLTVLNFGETLAQGDTKEALENPEVVRAYLGGD